MQIALKVEDTTNSNNGVIGEALQVLAQEIENAGDDVTAHQFAQLAEKAALDELYIAFCGHFSAGKSTFINTLIGKEVLSSGPIPTSANIVYVRKGEEKVTVCLKDGVERTVPLTDVSTLDGYLRDGEQVEAVQVTLPLTDWPEGVAILDTPGVDSTDEAHRAATEAALHLADIIVYVTDYNHVQSEVNFQFTRMLQERGKAVLWVVNQIDKHQEWEIPFSEYCARIDASFRDWGAAPAAVYFTSLVAPDHDLNQFTSFKELLQELVLSRADWLQQATDRAVRELIAQHRRWLGDRQRGERDTYAAVVAAGEGELGKVAHTRQQLEHVRQAPDELEAQMKDDVAKLLQNAPITPYETRELAKHYLESRQPGFRAGWLFAGKKTEQERERRLTTFVDSFRQKVQAHIDWHVKEMLIRLAREAEIADAAFEEVVYALEVPLDESWLAEQVQGGTTSDTYVLTYMEQLASAVKRRYKLAAETIIEQAVEAKTKQMLKVEKTLRTELAHFANVVGAQEQLSRLDEAVDEAITTLHTLWSSKVYGDRGEEGTEKSPARDFRDWLAQLTGAHSGEAHALATAALPNRTNQSAAVPSTAGTSSAAAAGTGGADGDETSGDDATGSEGCGAAGEEKTAAAREAITEVVTEGITEGITEAIEAVGANDACDVTSGTTAPLQQAGRLLEQTAELISGKVGLQAMEKALRERAERLRQKEMTVALFGAFSAGKSSFANAMIGQAVLPVSPNPTTAAVNRIVPPRETHPHGTARITFKSVRNLSEDIAASLAVFGETDCTDLFYSDDTKSRDGEQKVDARLQSEAETGIHINKLRRRVERLYKKSTRASAKPHLAFLRAVVAGWEESAPYLGRERLVDWAAYAGYVANEEQACFVESIDVYVDCPLTRAGVQLVDTPGADSVNARHTGVAFDYIKNADAIVFVTYYNHAFAQADRAFLEQLGRVKSAFELDKMWFIINAADLARTAAELDGVRDYVARELTACGISEPRLYALSSQTALWVKQAVRGKLPAAAEKEMRRRLGLSPVQSVDEAAGLRRTGFTSFFTDFMRTAIVELAELALTGAKSEVARTKRVIDGYAQAANQDKAERERQISAINMERQRALAVVEQLDWQAERLRLTQDVQELLYYVKQRFFYQLPERINETFNPAVFRDGRNHKGHLAECLRDLLTAIEKAILQELLATSLRVDKALARSGQHLFRQLAQGIGEDQEADWLVSYDFPATAEPAWLREPFTVPTADFAPALKHFKNAKDFFEGEGKKRLYEAFERQFTVVMGDFTVQYASKFSKYYSEQLDKNVVQLQQRIKEQVTQHYDGQIAVLTQTETGERWAALARKLATMLHETR